MIKKIVEVYFTLFSLFVIHELEFRFFLKLLPQLLPFFELTPVYEQG